LKKVLEGLIDINPLLVIGVDGGVKLNLKNAVAKLAVTVVVIISAISIFSLAILL